MEKIETKFRKIVTEIPPKESMELLDSSYKYESRSMSGQPPVVWHSAKGFQVYDIHGNMWLDWSSGVLVANTGHAAEEIKKAIIEQLENDLLYNYCFPCKPRIEFAKELVSLFPDELNKSFILTTGSEAIEVAIKLARTQGIKKYGKKKIGIISFENGFHGRTMGAQMVGGIPALKEWIVNLDKDMFQVPFPDGFRYKQTGFDVFLERMNELGINPKEEIIAVLMEPYQGGGASFAPKEYVQSLKRWCDENEVLFIVDEVQSGFGRTGKMFAFEHYDVIPDIVCCGKGISSALPLSAVVGKSEIMDLYGPGEMTSTHGGNPICCASALANIKLMKKEGIVEKAEINGHILYEGLRRIKEKYPSIVSALHGKGLVYGLHITKINSEESDGATAKKIVFNCFENGLLMFSPVGFGGATIKICPPLIITKEAIQEGLEVLNKAFSEICGDLE